MRRVVVSASVAVALLIAGVPVWAGAPTDQIRDATDRVLKLLQDPQLAKPANLAQRRKQIRAVADQVFDWQETGKRALGRHWRPLTPQQRADFSVLFADLVERSYIGKIEAYSGEKIGYPGDAIDGDEGTVRTKLITKNNTEIPIDYRMAKEGDRWRAYDVLIEGVSLIANYRTQFNQIIQQSGFDMLMKKLKTKQEELEYEDAQKEKAKP